MGPADLVVDPEVDEYFATDRVHAELRPRSVRSGVARLAGQAGKVVLFAGSGMVLARLLTPGDFGIYAMAMSYVALLMSVHGFGLQPATLQRRDLAPRHLEGVFWLNVWLSLGIVVIAVTAAPLVARFYGESVVTWITIVLVLGLFAKALGHQHRSLLARQLRFGALAAIDLVAVAVSVAVAVGAALAGVGYWALALQFAVAGILSSAGYWWRVSWRPGWAGALRTPWRDLEPFVRYGWPLSAAKLLSHLGRNLDRVLVAYFHGSRPVGLYDNAYRWAHYPVHQVFPSLISVAVSSLSRAREGAGRYSEGMRMAMLPVLSLVLPALAFMAREARPVILTILGDQWIDTIPIFRWLCVAAFARALESGTRWIYLSEGRTVDRLRWTAIETSALMGAVSIGVAYGAFGVAVAFTVATCLTTGPSIAYCLRDSDLTPGDFLAALWRPALASLSAMVVLAGLEGLVGEADGAFSTLLLRFGAFTAAYLIVWVALPGGRGELRGMTRLVAELVRR